MERLECSRIAKRYGRGAYALRDISLSIPASGIFALIGRNGAGKTTLVRILATQLSATSGSAHIDGIDVLRQAQKLRERIASVPQEARAVGWLTARQSMVSYLLWRGFGYSEAVEKASRAAKQLGIVGSMDLPNRMLSGGNKRKVLVASAVASGARILFLDEPTTGLDPISRKELWDILMSLKGKHFIFLTTHYLEEAEYLADKIGILDGGRLKAIGTMAELRKMVKRHYIIRTLSDGAVARPVSGTLTRGADGHYQISTTE